MHFWSLVFNKKYEAYISWLSSTLLDCTFARDEETSIESINIVCDHMLLTEYRKNFTYDSTTSTEDVLNVPMIRKMVRKPGDSYANDLFASDLTIRENHEFYIVTILKLETQLSINGVLRPVTFFYRSPDDKKIVGLDISQIAMKRYVILQLARKRKHSIILMNDDNVMGYTDHKGIRSSITNILRIRKDIVDTNAMIGFSSTGFRDLNPKGIDTYCIYKSVIINVSFLDSHSPSGEINYYPECMNQGEDMAFTSTLSREGLPVKKLGYSIVEATDEEKDIAKTGLEYPRQRLINYVDFMLYAFKNGIIKLSFPEGRPKEGAPKVLLFRYSGGVPLMPIRILISDRKCTLYGKSQIEAQLYYIRLTDKHDEIPKTCACTGKEICEDYLGNCFAPCFEIDSSKYGAKHVVAAYLAILAFLIELENIIKGSLFDDFVFEKAIDIVCSLSNDEFLKNDFNLRYPRFYTDEYCTRYEIANKHRFLFQNYLENFTLPKPTLQEDELPVKRVRVFMSTERK